VRATASRRYAFDEDVLDIGGRHISAIRVSLDPVLFKRFGLLKRFGLRTTRQAWAT
jgi:hypothetical protein